MSFFDKFKKKEQQRQDLNVPVYLKILYKVWMVLFTTIKVVIGAAATVAMIFLVCMFVFTSIVGDYLEEDIATDSHINLADYEVELNSYLYYVKDGKIKEYQEVYSAISREWAGYEEIPENLINAAIAIEDHRFYEHQGVDWITTFKAVVRMFFGNDDAGGSSITQQLVKNVTGESGVTVQRKVLEIFKATELERNYDKKVIMEHYLNHIYLGQSCYGVRTAAEAYFGKELEDLNLAECAALISITNSPTYYDPWQNYENNKERKENVLYAMLQYDLITEQEYKEAINYEIVLKAGVDSEDRNVSCPNTSCGYRGRIATLRNDSTGYYCPSCSASIAVDEEQNSTMYSYYTDTVLEDVAKALAERDGMEWNDQTEKMYKQQIQTGGYHIYTCIDVDVQATVDKIYKDVSQLPAYRGGQQLQSAIIIKDKTGDIVAMAGGVGDDKVFDGLNRATDSDLQSGSSIKPLTVYGPAFESGSVTPATVLKDMPISYGVHAAGAYPRNDSYRYDYAKTVYSGIYTSTNTIAVRTLNRIGIDYSYEFATEKLHLSTLVEEYVSDSGYVSTDKALGPLALGAQTWGVKVRDMADAFHTFNNEGNYVKGRTFTKVLDSNGNVVLDNKQKSEQVFSEKTVNYMNYCLTQAADFGTGHEADLSESLGISTAGKTGSTADYKDRWFCGFTGYYTAAVWMGFDIPERIELVYGGNGAAQMWKKVMTPLHQGKTDVPLYDSSKLKYVTMCLDSGLPATSACKNDIRTVKIGLSRMETAVVYSEDYPGGACNKHVSVDYCVTGGGVATDYCKNFAQADKSVKIEKRSLLKMTKTEMNNILVAASYGLASSNYVRDDYVYLIDGSGNNASFKGFYNNSNKNVDAPYQVCTKHTKEAWDKYQASQDQETEEDNGGIF